MAPEKATGQRLELQGIDVEKVLGVLLQDVHSHGRLVPRAADGVKDAADWTQPALLQRQLDGELNHPVNGVFGGCFSLRGQLCLHFNSLVVVIRHDFHFHCAFMRAIQGPKGQGLNLGDWLNWNVA